MRKNKIFWIVFGLWILFAGVINAFISQYRAEQDRLYEECLQDWTESGATQEEARDNCDIYLE